MRRFWKRDDEPAGLERELQASKPEPSPEFLETVSERFRSGRVYRRTGTLRIAFAGVLTAGALVAVASFGGLNYAAAAAKNVISVHGASTDQGVNVVTGQASARNGEDENGDEDEYECDRRALAQHQRAERQALREHQKAERQALGPHPTKAERRALRQHQKAERRALRQHQKQERRECREQEHHHHHKHHKHHHHHHNHD